MKRVMWVYDFTPKDKFVLLRGNVRPWLMGHRVPAYWLPRWRGWQVRSERVPDVLALAELDGILVAERGPAQIAAPTPRALQGRELPSPPRNLKVDDALPLLWGAA